MKVKVTDEMVRVARRAGGFPLQGNMRAALEAAMEEYERANIVVPHERYGEISLTVVESWDDV